MVIFTPDHTKALVVLCLFVLMDFISGLLKAIGTGTFESSKMRTGLFHKLGELLAWFFCLACDLTLPQFQITLPFKLVNAVTVYIVLMESGSIIENVGVLNPAIGKYLTGVFEKVKKPEEAEDDQGQ